MINPFSALTSKIYGGVAIGALAVAGMQTARIEGFLFIDGFKDDLAERERVIATLEAQSAANLAAQQAQKEAWEAKLDQLSKENREHEARLRDVLGTRAAAYADRMRLDKVCRSQANPAADPDPSPVDNEPGGDAIVLDRRDYDTLIENTVRLKAVHDWGNDLIKSGQAKPVPSLESVFTIDRDQRGILAGI